MMKCNLIIKYFLKKKTKLNAIFKLFKIKTYYLQDINKMNETHYKPLL